MIPCILINRDRLSTTEKLVDHLLMLGYEDLYILDMESTYPPLLEYYNTCKNFTLISHKNTGHKALWNDGLLKELFSKHQWVAVTDSDISLNPDTPRGFIESMISVAKDYRVSKVGCAIEYRDISNEYLKTIIEPIESRYWSYKLPHPVHKCYLAPVDTTMCVVQTDKPFMYDAVRVAGDYTIRHEDWYSDWDDMTEEQQYYMDKADETIATTKQHYLKWKEGQNG